MGMAVGGEPVLLLDAPLLTRTHDGIFEELYDVREPLGKGAFGVVVTCVQKATGKVCRFRCPRQLRSELADCMQLESSCLTSLSLTIAHFAPALTSPGEPHTETDGAHAHVLACTWRAPRKSAASACVLRILTSCPSTTQTTQHQQRHAFETLLPPRYVRTRTH